MRKFNSESSVRTAMMLLAGACLAVSLSGCIHRDLPGSSGGGGSTPGGAACANLPATATTYKGGDALGEELTLSLNPTTLAYSITLDVSGLRSNGTVFSGTLVQLDGCKYAADAAEGGAVFTIGANGVVQGGVRTVSGTSFAPLLAFATTYNNAGTPAVFNDVALTFNALGVQTTAGVTTSYGGSSRIRNAGTMQFCADVYSANTCSTEKGYFTYNSGHDAFDYFALDPSAAFPKTLPTSGTAVGSMIIGTITDVDAGTTVDVALFLRRVSATDYGMRLMTNQVSVAANAANGNYLVVDSSGSNANSIWAGNSFTRGSDVTTLTYDAPSTVTPPPSPPIPVLGLIAVTPTGASTLTGYQAYGGGVYGFVPTSTGSAAFEMGLKE